jgi:hypothetical protein
LQKQGQEGEGICCCIKEENEVAAINSYIKVITDKMKGKNNKLTINKLCLLVTHKKTKEDAAIPSGGGALLA